MRLKGKSIVVTGASAGMGRCMAEAFVKEGANVVAVARRKEVLEELKEETANCPGKLEIYTGDCAKQKDCEAMIDFAVNTFGRLDALVNNAGIMDDTAAIGELDEDLMQKVYQLNTFGVYYSIKKAVNVFLSQERQNEELPSGTILTITSVGSHHHIAGPVYCGSKAAAEAATLNTAFMYMEEGIRCNCIAPGGVITDIFSNMPERNPFGSERVDMMLPLAPPLGEAEAIADAAVFLVSDESRYINGQTLRADGGWMNF